MKATRLRSHLSNAFRQAMPRPVLHLISSTPLFPGLGSCPHFQLYSPEYLCKAFFFLSLPRARGTLPCASHALAFLHHIRCQLLVLTSQPTQPSPPLSLGCKSCPLDPPQAYLHPCLTPLDQAPPHFHRVPPPSASGPPQTSAKPLQPPQPPP